MTEEPITPQRSSELPAEVLAKAYKLGAEAARVNGTYDYPGAGQVVTDAVAPSIFAAGVQAGREAEVAEARAARRTGYDPTLGYSDGWDAGYVTGRADGRDEGREAVAADIEEHPGPDPSPASDVWWAGYSEAQRDAARIARGDSQEADR